MGTDSVTATYAAAGNFAGSTSSATSVTVNQASQTITFPAIASRAYGSAPFAVTATSSAGSSYPVTITVQSGPAVISGGIGYPNRRRHCRTAGFASRRYELQRGHGRPELPGNPCATDRDCQ